MECYNCCAIFLKRALQLLLLAQLLVSFSSCCTYCFCCAALISNLLLYCFLCCIFGARLSCLGAVATSKACGTWRAMQYVQMYVKWEMRVDMVSTQARMHKTCNRLLISFITSRQQGSAHLDLHWPWHSDRRSPNRHVYSRAANDNASCAYSGMWTYIPVTTVHRACSGARTCACHQTEWAHCSALRHSSSRRRSSHRIAHADPGQRRCLHSAGHSGCCPSWCLSSRWGHATWPLCCRTCRVSVVAKSVLSPRRPHCWAAATGASVLPALRSSMFWRPYGRVEQLKENSL